MKIGALKGASFLSGASLFGVLLAAISKILNVDVHKAMDYVSLRLPRARNEQAFGDILQSMDCAIEVVDYHDIGMYKESIKDAATKDFCIEQLKLEYAQKRAEVEDMLPKKKKPKSGAAACVAHLMSQEEAKVYAPPGASVWLSRTRAEWWGHLAPWRRVVATYQEGEEEHAIKECLQKLWLQDLEGRGLPHSDCPWPGLLDVAP